MNVTIECAAKPRDQDSGGFGEMQWEVGRGVGPQDLLFQKQDHLLFNIVSLYREMGDQAKVTKYLVKQKKSE